MGRNEKEGENGRKGEGRTIGDLLSIIGDVKKTKYFNSFLARASKT
jgi:hypothetical protein